MSDIAAIALEVGAPEPPPQPSRARIQLLKRLADVVCLPSSRVNAFERAMTADLLVELLREASLEERVRVARRLAALAEPPPTLSRLLLRDVFAVAKDLLEHCLGLGDTELIDCVRNAGPEHRRLIAQRRTVSEVLSEALVDSKEDPVIDALLRNEQARLSPAAVETLVAQTREQPPLIPALLRRRELRPAHAYVMFWWAEEDARKVILQRFAVSREVLQEAAGDVFALAADERWADGLTRKALQFIDRRQRNRAALDRSPFDSLEDAVAASEDGLGRELMEEISYLAGLKPMTGSKIFSDKGGEAVAILCKATGLSKGALRTLWRGLRHGETAEADEAGLARAVLTYDTIAVDRAQTVLRYWNWSLTSALTPALLSAIEAGSDSPIDEFSTAQRVAMLALGADRDLVSARGS